jgi:hypothetical protein
MDLVANGLCLIIVKVSLHRSYYGSRHNPPAELGEGEQVMDGVSRWC